MGEKFVNYQVRCDSQHDVALVVKKITQNQAYVSPSKNGWITVYDQTSEKFNHDCIRNFIQKLSAHLSTTVFAFIVFSGLHFIYLLYDKGEIIDEFYDDPEDETFGYDYADDLIIKRFQGNPSKLLKYCTEGTKEEKFSELFASLKQRDLEYLGQEAVYNFAPLFNIDVAMACQHSGD